MPSAPSTAPRANTVVAVLAFGGIVVALMQTMVIPLAPEFPRLLGTTPSSAAWVITATLLAGAVVTPVVGRLGDMYGKRRMLLVSLVVLVAGSVVCALADSLVPMVVGRTAQGLAGGVIALGISIMRDELPPERLGSATALMSASLGVGGALGLPAATFLVERADWHVLFWVASGFGLLATALVVTLVPESPVRSGGRFDVVGAVGLSTALLCLLLAISQGADWGWTSTATTSLFGGSVVVLLLWGWWELRAERPLVDLRTTARRQVLLTNLASAVFGFAMFAMALVIPQLLQLPEATGYGLGQSMLAVGLVMAPNGLVMMAMAPLSARISRTSGPRTTLMVGAAVVACGYALGIGLMSSIWELMLVSCVIGAGVGLAYGAMPALIMAAVPVSETAAANSLNTLMRAIGTSVSSAVAGVILAQLTIPFGEAAVPAQDGFRLIMAIGAAAALVALLVTAFIPGARSPGRRVHEVVPPPMSSEDKASPTATKGARREERSWLLHSDRCRTPNDRPPPGRCSCTSRCRWTGSWQARTTRWTGWRTSRTAPASSRSTRRRPAPC
jgi:MFS family permease